MNPLITNDAIVLGILIAIFGAVFITAHSDAPIWKKPYTYIPPLLLCYYSRISFALCIDSRDWHEIEYLCGL